MKNGKAYSNYTRSQHSRNFTVMYNLLHCSATESNICDLCSIQPHYSEEIKCVLWWVFNHDTRKSTEKS
jgi:hypothetical protein